MEEVTKVLAPGTPVILNYRSNKDFWIDGHIIGVRIRELEIYYEIEYWSGPQRTIEYFSPAHFIINAEKPNKIGFVYEKA